MARDTQTSFDLMPDNLADYGTLTTDDEDSDT